MESKITWYNANEKLPPVADTTNYERVGVLVIVEAPKKMVMAMEWQSISLRGKAPIGRFMWKDRIVPWKVLYWAYMPDVSEVGEG